MTYTCEFIGVDDARWASMLSRTEHDVYHLPAYAAAVAVHERGLASAFYFRDGDAQMLAPLIVREVPFGDMAAQGWRDAASPYGYSPPIFSGVRSNDEAARLYEALLNCARDAGYVSIFVRLHPLIHTHDTVAAQFGTIVRHGQTVYLDLTRPWADLERSMRRNHRRDIRRLVAAGYKTFLDDWSSFGEFTEAYRETMEHVGAEDYYWFSGGFFDALRPLYGDAMHLALVRGPDGETACAGLYSSECGIVQTYLAGTPEKGRQDAPAKLMDYDMIRWAKDHGYRYFHFGGGVGSRGDSVFAYKAGFSDLRAQFSTLRIVVDPSRYAACVHAWGSRKGCASDDPGFFPEYRRPRLNSEPTQEA